MTVLRRRSCPKRSKAGRYKRRRCKRLVPAGSFTHPDAAGPNALGFTGRVGGLKLRPGRYVLSAVAAESTGQAGAPVTARLPDRALTFTTTVMRRGPDR